MIQEVYHLLLKEYGIQGWWPLDGKHSGKIPISEDEKFEIIIGAILTQNTSWSNVEKALTNLRKNNLLHKKAIQEVDIQKLAELIKPAGYFNQKAKKIKIISNTLFSTREELLNIWGVGPETADSILLYALQKPFFVIDAYTKRIFSRLGIEGDYGTLQNIFTNDLPKDIQVYKEYHALIVEHAKQHCKAKPVCEECILKEKCKFR